MAYTAQDKYEMTLRQARVDIGMGRGNALSKAVDLEILLLSKLESGMAKITEEQIIEDIFRYADRFAKFNQQQIDADYAVWFKENDDKLKAELGIDIPVIDEGASPDFPTK